MNIVVFASGEGTNFEAIVQASQEKSLKANVAGLIVNREGVGVLERATRLKVPAKILAPKAFAGRTEWDRAVLQQLKDWRADWVVLAGFLALVGPDVLAAFPQRIVNSHPALLPKFGGPGMFGDHVHSAVLKAGEKQSGVTIHFIDEVYDRGRIIAQERVQVLPGDTLATLSARVKALETSMYPRVLNDLVTGRIATR